MGEQTAHNESRELSFSARALPPKANPSGVSHTYEYGSLWED
jgi:hypothetical protein